jgi:hypothetical protein
MNETAKDILERVATWPQEDQEELAEIAREIEGRRNGIYVLDGDEKAAIEAARRSDVASGDDVAAFWKRHGVK